MKLILAICLLFNYVCFGSRSFFSPNMCKNRQTNDCSFQFPNVTTGKCLISNNVCKSYNFSSWNLKPLTVPASESDIPLNISVVPYALHRNYFRNIFSAINITMTVLHKDVEGFSFVMYDEVITGEKLCRIFDFRTVADREVMLYYDCLHRLFETNKKDVTLTFRIYPQNIEVTYFLSIPPYPLKYYDSPCSWRPLIMIFQGGLQSYHIQLKFSNAPDNLNILFYFVTLLNINDTDVESIRIYSNNGINMLSAEFVSAEEGYFSISIAIVVANEISCEVAKTYPFFVSYKTEDYSIVTLIILLAVMLILASVLLYTIFRRRCTTVNPPSLTLLFVYSIDCPQHKEFLLAYIKFMEENYAVKIYTIYGDSGNPNAWIEEKYFASDIIVFVISEGLFHYFERNNIPPLMQDHWEDQLLAAEKFISEQKFIRTFSDDKSKRMKQICKICFPYSGKQHVPKCLMQKGSLFMLPNDEDKFLCFIFRCSKFLYCKTHHKKKLVNSHHVKDRLTIMKEIVSKNMHVSYKETEVKGTVSEAIESLNKNATCKDQQLSSGDFLKSIFEETCKESIEFPKQKSNFTCLESEDAVRYFIHKEFHN